MLEFFDYSYAHKKYYIGPSSRDSSVFDPINELEKELSKEWYFQFEKVFAKAIITNPELNFYYINKEVVDENHLSLEDLLKFFNQGKKEKKIFYYNNQNEKEEMFV